MKPEKINTLVIPLATRFGVSGGLAGTFQSGTIDGDFSDRAGVPVLAADLVAGIR
jgi:hypothetical protein